MCSLCIHSSALSAASQLCMHTSISPIPPPLHNFVRRRGPIAPPPPSTLPPSTLIPAGHRQSRVQEAIPHPDGRHPDGPGRPRRHRRGRDWLREDGGVHDPLPGEGGKGKLGGSWGAETDSGKAAAFMIPCLVRRGRGKQGLAERSRFQRRRRRSVHLLIPCLVRRGEGES